MPPLSRRFPRARLLLVAALVGGLLAGGGPDAGPAAAYPATTVNLTGHGWGHGRGMGQFGAQGYAVNFGWSYTRILDHFYGGTVMGTVGNDPISVHITRKDNVGVIVLNAVQAGGNAGIYVEKVGANQFRIQTGPGCGGPWNNTSIVGGPVALNPKEGGMELCDPTDTTRYAGAFEVKDHDGSKLINHVDTESYVRGVVPRESPSSFHTNALKAQAVAARSYARAFARDLPYALQCDTTKCQVYGGISAETGPTNTAVNDTAGQVLRHTSNNAVASTEFSSSTGGYTAGGTFPAVLDEGDTISSNPNHTWTAKVSVSAIQAAYPEIGTLLAVSVTKRNGLGEWGGRVLEVVLRGTNGSATITGETFRSKFGLKSNWFLVTNSESGGVDGYWIVAPDGGVFAFGNAGFFGSTGAMRLNQPVVGMAATASNGGYWLVARDGGIFSFGNAAFHGSTGGMRLNQPIVGMARTADGGGYWLVASDGGIFSFGNAAFHGSMGGTRLNQPVVGMAATPTGGGYWLVASDGGIFSFGDAAFHGSTGAMRLNQPITGMTPTPTGGGYWLVASDGGIFSFGNAGFFGSLPGIRAAGPAEAMRATKTGGGYLIVTSAGKVYPFGDAPYFEDVAVVVPGYRGGVEGIEVRRQP